MDSAGGERWMTYAEIAEARGCSRAAAERWTQRQKLRRQPGNDGKTRVLVAPNALGEAQPRSYPRTATPNGVGDITPALAAFEQALTALREAHAGETSTLRERLEQAAGEARGLREQLEQARTDVAGVTSTLREQLAKAQAEAEEAIKRADADRSAAEGRAEKAEAVIASERSRADTLRERLDSAERDLVVARHDAVAVQQAAAELRLADKARKARGRWARLRAAWRGE